MAKIMYGSLAGAVSGALGNDVFSRGRHGAYLRKRVIPTKTVNTYTLRVKNILTICSRAWGLLTAEQQAAWNTWAQSHPITDRLGQKQVLFGSGAYTQLNARLLYAGDTAIAVPPASAPPAPLTTLTAVVDASAHTAILTTAPTPLGAANRLWIDVALVNSPGRQYVANLYKLVAVSAKNQATGLGIGAALELRFGTLIVPEHYHIRASIFDSTTGLLSAPKGFTALVVA
jgi:hypothetical protein